MRRPFCWNRPARPKCRRTIFPKGTEGILNVDRFKCYFGLLGPDWKIKLAYCWSHQRRDFVNLAEGSRGLQSSGRRSGSG